LGLVHVHLTGGGGRRLRRRYLKAIAASKEQLYLAHAYFLPDRRLVRALRAAAHRGVDVKLLLAGRSDVPFARAATMRLYRQLIFSGIRIFEWTESVLHAKAAVVDQERLLLGSFNLDPLSLANQETLVEVKERTAAREAQEWMEKRMWSSVEVTWQTCERSALQRFFLDALGLFGARMAQWVAWLLRSRLPAAARRRVQRKA
jgi:cardiolipin synthase